MRSLAFKSVILLDFFFYNTSKNWPSHKCNTTCQMQNNYDTIQYIIVVSDYWEANQTYLTKTTFLDFYSTLI